MLVQTSENGKFKYLYYILMTKLMMFHFYYLLLLNGHHWWCDFVKLEFDSNAIFRF